AAAGCAAGVRGSPRVDAGPAAPRLPVRPHARRQLHDRQGAERASLSADWRARSASSAVASQRRARARRAHVEDQSLPHGAVLEVPGPAARDARRRRLAARSHDDPVRVRHLQQHAPFGRQPAAARDRRRIGDAEGRPPSRLHRQADDGEPARDAGGQDGSASGEDRRQHRRAVAGYALGRVKIHGVKSTHVERKGRKNRKDFFSVSICACFACFAFLTGVASATETSPLLDAAKSADTEAVRALVQKKVDVNAAAADGTTALHWASYRDDVATADLLIRAGARVDAATDLGVTPLWNASLNGSEAMVARLLKAGANPNAALLLGETPVMAAARSGYPAVVEQLIAKGANVNAHGARGQTALMWAVSQQHPDVVKVLIAHGAEIHARSDVCNEVMAVRRHGHLDYSRAIPHGGDTALMFAARVGDLESASRLVAAGANVNDADAWGVSATALAAHAGHRELVVFLLDHGA